VSVIQLRPRDPLDAGLTEAAPLGAEQPKPDTDLKRGVIFRPSTTVAVPELKARVEPVVAPEPPNPEPPTENADNEYLARGMTGDEAAEQLQQLSMTGLPYAMAMQAPGAVAAIAKEKEQQDIAAMSEYTPSLKAWREANPHRTAITRDKFVEMGKMEWLLKAPGQAVNRSFFRDEITNINMHDMDGTMTPEMAARRDVLEEASAVGGEDYGSSWVGRFLTMPAENVANIGRTMTAGGKLSANAAAAVATTSLLLKLPPAVTLEATALAMKSGAIIGSGIEEGRLERANAFREYTMIPGVDREAARLAANVVGIINGAFGMTEAKILFDSIPAFKNLGTKAAIKAAVGEALKDPTTAAKFAALAKEVGASFGEGVAQEVGQRASTILGEHYARAEAGLPLRSAGEIVGDIGAEAEGAAFMYPLMLLPGASINSYRIAREHKYSEDRPDKAIDKLNEAATKIPFAKSPETYKSFVKEAAAGTGKETAYVNLEGFQTLYQTQDEDPRAKAVELFGSAEAYDEAVASGGPIAVPIEEWTAMVSQSSDKSALSEHVSFDPDGMTRYEYEAAQAESDQDITAEDVGAEDATTDLQALEDDIRGMLVGSAHTPESADVFAKYLASGYGAAASRSGRSLASIRAMFDPIIKQYMPGLESAASNTKVLESQIHMIQMGQGPTDKDMYGDSVLEFIRKNGGLKYDKGGELKSMDARFQRLINEGGHNLDDMAGMAQEAGYITEHDQNALLDLIADELGGKKAYSTRNVNSNAERMNADLNALHDAIKAFDIDLSQTPQQIAKQLHAKNNEQVAAGGGDTLFQKQGKAEPKGSVTFTGTQAIIKLFKAQDRSTFIHEGSHIFLRMLIELTKDGNGTPQMQADMQTLLKWWKIESPDQITVKHEEKFAKGFEKWVSKGEAPSLALRDVFAAMSAWLMRVYSGIVHRGIAVSPAVEDVMKRMMATDAEITAAMEQKGALDLLTEIDKQNILAPEELEAYRKDIQRKHDDAVAQQLKKLTAAKEKAERDLSKSHYQAIKDEVTKQVHAMRVYRTIFAMKHGTTPDGIALPNVENLKFNAADLAENYGTNARGDDKKIIKNPLVARLRELGLVASGQKQYERDQKTGKPITRNGKKVRLPDLGMRLEDVARVTGYNTADEMVEELASSPDMNEAIKAETERRMRVEHPDVIYDGTLAMEAVDEVTTGETGLAIALAEQRAMRAVAAVQRKAEAVADRKARNAEKSAGPPITLAMARQYAKNVLWNKPIGQIKPEQYRKVARAAALKAIDAVKAKDFAAAVKHKRTEILNIALYTEARKIEKSVNTKRNQMLALTSVRMRQAIGRAGEGYLEQIEALLARVEMKKISDVRRRQIMPLQAFVQALQAEFKDGEVDPTSVAYIPPKLSEFVMSGAKPYQEMTVAEFNALHDDVIQLATLARDINKLLDDKAKQTLSEGQEALAGAVRDNARDGRQAITHNEMRLPQHKLMRGLRWFAAHHRNFASHVREVFDGLKDNGVGFKLLLKGLQKAGDTQAKMHRDATLALGKAAKIYNKRERLMMTRNPKIVPGTNIALTHMGRLMFALNLGNADNTNKMMQAGFATRTATDARGNKVPIPITKAEVRAILDTLTAKDVKFLNNIWAQLDSYYDAVAEKEKKIRGIAAPRVVATPFDVKAGHLTGGYLPIEGEMRASVSFRNQLSQSAERLMSEGGGQILPSRDFTHERQAKAKHPPFRLDFSVVTQHIAEVTHYLSYYEYVMDTARLLGADNVRNSVVDVYGDQVYNELRNALKRVAAGHIQQSDGMAGMAARWRVGASAGGMALNMLTAIVQLLGVIPAMTRVGPTWIAKGFVSAMAGDHGQIFRTRGWIRSQSQFMANRKDVMNREMAELNDRHFSTSIAETAFKTAGASFFWLIAQLQSLTDTVVWIGAYEKALAEKKDGGMGAESHEDAVLLADRTIRDTQGSGQIGDLSGMMSGGQVQRLFTTFYSYMNQMQMLSAETIAMARQMGGAGGAAYAFASLALIVVVPVVLQEAIYAALRGDWDDDDPEEIAVKLARSTLAAGMGLFVGAREVSGAVEGFHQYNGPAGMGPVAGAVTLVGQAQQGELDRAFWKAALTTGSGIQPIPTTQLMRLYDAVEQDQYNQVRPAWMVAAFGKPAK